MSALATDLFNLLNLFKDFAEMAGEKSTTIDHHIYFSGTGIECILSVLRFDCKAGTTGRESSRDSRNRNIFTAD